MSLPKLLNRFLSPFDLAVIKRSSLDNTQISLNSQIEVGKLINKPDLVLASIENLDRKLFKLHQETLRSNIALYWRFVDHKDSIKPEPQEIQCELCGYTASGILFKNYYSNCMFGGGRLKRYQCPSCDVIFGPRKILDLTAEELSQEYNLHYSAYEEGESKEREIRTFFSLNPSKSGIYLNYGSGSWSSTIPALRNEGWNILAYEPHSSAAIRDWCISDINELQKIKFDGIFTNNVLEHFRNPVEELKKISGYLKSNGKMAHATPCFEYLYEFTRFHLYFYLGRSRRYMIEKAGLKEEDYIVDGDFMNLILSKA